MRYGVWILLVCSFGRAQNPMPQEAGQGIIKLFDTYRIVMPREIHECRQEYDLMRKLIAGPGFAARVNDIVMEFGNARYRMW
jgi:hypothetical protein